MQIRVTQRVTKSINCLYSLESFNGLLFKIVLSERIWLPMVSTIIKANVKIDIEWSYSDRSEQLGFAKMV